MGLGDPLHDPLTSLIGLKLRKTLAGNLNYFSDDGAVRQQ